MKLTKYEFITPKECADYLRVSKRTIYMFIAAKKLPVYRFGRQYRINKLELPPYS